MASHDQLLRGCRRVNMDVSDEALEELASHDHHIIYGGVDRATANALRCSTKKRYGERQARRAARILNDRTNEALTAYPCQAGGHWHVGHVPIVPPRFRPVAAA